MSADSIDLALVNANVLTMDRMAPRAQAIAISRDRIAAIGNNADIRRATTGRTRVIDCHGLTLLPGFNDAHCHLAGFARKLQDLDCGPGLVSSISELQAAIRRWSAGLPVGSWVRGRGYDDLGLAEKRHPNRHDLDSAAPDRPVWLDHRSGHAAALNGQALLLAGIHRETPDPPEGVIERDPYTGEPTGVVFEMHGFLRRRLGGTRTPSEFTEGMRAVNSLLNRYGITSVQDAGAENGLDRWTTFRQFQSTGVLTCRITMFAGIRRLGEFAKAGLSFGSKDQGLRLGHAKIMLTMTTGNLNPGPDELSGMIEGAHRQGFPVAVHCIEEEAIVAAAEALTACRQPHLFDRIEHCTEGTPRALEAVRRSGATVVTQPGFLYHNGPAYRENVAEVLLPHLYPVHGLMAAGVPVAFSSDAPVIDPNPWPAIYSAVTRRTADGSRLSSDEQDGQEVAVAKAIRMYTLASAAAEDTESFKGAIMPGRAADMVLLEEDPTSISPERLPQLRARMTVIGGRIVWGKE